MIQRYLHIIIQALFFSLYLSYCLFTGDTLYMFSQAILCIPFFLNYFYWTPWLLQKNNTLYWSIWVIFFWSLNLVLYMGFYKIAWSLDSAYKPYPYIHLISGGINCTFFLVAISTGSRLTKEWIINQKKNQELIIERQITELQTLKSKINLPFVLKVLSQMEKRAQESPKQIEDSIISLSNILRHGLYESKASYITLECELKVLGDHVKLVNQLEEKRSLILQEIDVSPFNITPTLLVRLFNAWMGNLWKSKEGVQYIALQHAGKALILLLPCHEARSEDQNHFVKQFPVYHDAVSSLEYTFRENSLEVKIVDLNL